jgi:hypothetical protein
MKIDFEMIQKIFNKKIKIKNKKDKITLSKYADYIPMYDIYTDMIYPINSLKLYYRLVDCHYRFITDEIKQWIINKKEKQSDTDIIKKYNDILDILDNYDLETLEKTSYETLYRYAPDFGMSISICKRNSFHPYTTHLTPYYSKTELIKLGMNNMLIEKLEPSNLVDKKLHYEICKKVSKNDISYETIINHMKHIIDNKSINWIVFYSMTGSYIFNKILRENMPMKQYMYDGLTKIVETINKVNLPNDYYFYRFIWDDSFVKNLKIGDMFIDNGFLSATRDPFYSPGIKGDFGLILIRINIPQKINGVGLLIENFSMFPKEEEYLIQPFMKLKLKAKDDKATYYHINDKFEKLIKKRYEFDLIGTTKQNIKVESDDTIPYLDIKNITIDSYDRTGIFRIFLEKCDNYGQFRIDNMIFIAQWFDSTGSYNHMYKNKTKDGFIITYYDDGYPILSIEMGEQMYVNYFRTICYYDNIDNIKPIEEYYNIIANCCRIFKYKNAMILFNYKNFSNFIDNYSKDTEYLYSKLYCDTIYQYYKNGKLDIPKYCKFEYGVWMLDKIGNTTVNNIIINKLPKEIRNDKMKWKELYIIIVEKYFYLYKRMEEWINNIFNNLFDKIYFTFNVIPYLNNQGYRISDFPTIKHITRIDRGDIFKTVFNDNIRRS